MKVKYIAWMIVMIVLMMTKPVLTRPGVASLPSSGAKVLIIDNSLSMGYREKLETRFDVAKRAANQSLAGFTGRVFLIPTVTKTDWRPWPTVILISI